MQTLSIKITAKLWLWNEGKGSWHFVTVDKDSSDVIKDTWMWPRKGFGSVPVKVTIGKTRWKTSVFPQKDGTFVLPIKKTVRDSENINQGDTIKITLEVLN
jgi:hypothetical protein